MRRTCIRTIMRRCVLVQCLEATIRVIWKTDKTAIYVVEPIVQNCNFIKDGPHHRRFAKNFLNVFKKIELLHFRTHSESCFWSCFCHLPKNNYSALCHFPKNNYNA